MNSKVYQALALKHGLKLYATHSIKPNTMWTPGKMLKAASAITGKPYKRREYDKAIADLHAWLGENGK